MARILLVDDSASIRSLIRVFLMPAGFEFLEADSGERALSVMKLIPASLVIVDVNMPGMGGLEFVRQVRAHTRPQVRGAPIILLTGESSPEAMDEGLRAGANAFLMKPVKAEQLKDTVKSLLAEAAP